MTNRYGITGQSVLNEYFRFILNFILSNLIQYTAKYSRVHNSIKKKRAFVRG